VTTLHRATPDVYNNIVAPAAYLLASLNESSGLNSNFAIMPSPEVKGSDVTFLAIHPEVITNPSPVPSLSLASPYAAYIGLDWSDQKHDICLFDPLTQQKEFLVIATHPHEIALWLESLRLRFKGQPIAICLEQKRGPLIYTLCQFDFLVLFPVNPKMVSDYRHAFTPSRAKADPTDADLLLDLLRTHTERLSPWTPGSRESLTLQQFTESRRMLVGEKVRLTNRITDALKHFYPQVLEWFADTDTQVFCLFLERYPNLEAAQAADPQELTHFFRSHQVVQSKTITRRLTQIQQTPLTTTDPAILEPFQWLGQTLIQQLLLLLKSILELEDKIAALFDSLPDAAFFAALPGAGPHLAPR
jgi:Transposase